MNSFQKRINNDVLKSVFLFNTFFIQLNNVIVNKTSQTAILYVTNYCFILIYFCSVVFKLKINS